MTHAEKELVRLKEAFVDWAKREAGCFNLYESQECSNERANSAQEAAELFWPFVKHALNDLSGSAEKTAMLNRFKAAMGMELMAHEKFFGDEK